jgi:hypothetical protein
MALRHVRRRSPNRQTNNSSLASATQRRTFSVSKRKNSTGKRVKQHRLLDQDSGSVDTQPEIKVISMQIHVQLSIQTELCSAPPFRSSPRPAKHHVSQIQA